MNQYRCETCDKDCVYANQTPTDELFYCQKFEYDWVRKFTSVKGCTSHSNFQSERDTVLDIGEILESLCKTDLYWYIKGVTEGEDVGKCRGKDCNYCGRYNEKLR